MKKIIFFIAMIFWLFTFNFLFGQNPGYFSRRWDFVQMPEVAWTILNDTNKSFIVFSGVYDLEFDARNGVSKIDSLGNVISKKIIGRDSADYYPGSGGSATKNTFGYSLGGTVQYPNGNSDIYLMKLDNNLDTLWIKTFGEPNFWDAAYSARQTADKGFVLVGVTDSTEDLYEDMVLLKTDSMGNLMWKKRFGTSGRRDCGFSVEITHDLGFIIGGYSYTFGQYDVNSYVIKTDSIGNIEWQKYYGGAEMYNGAIIKPCLNSNDILFTVAITTDLPNLKFTTALAKIDSAGNLLWVKKYGPNSEYEGPVGIKEYVNGNIIITGQFTDTSSAMLCGYALKTNSFGDSLWHKSYSIINGLNYFRDFVLTPDGGFAACGFVQPSISLGDTGTQDNWVIKVDSFGCDTQNCQLVNIYEITFSDWSIAVFPNPVFSVFNISIDNYAEENKLSLEIYDATGRLLSRQNLIAANTQINLQGLSAGIYFLSLKTQSGKKKVLKIIKQ